MNEINTVQIAIAFAGVRSKFYQTFWQNLSRSTLPRLKSAGKCSKLRRVARTAVMSRFLHNDNTREHWELFLYLNLFTNNVCGNVHFKQHLPLVLTVRNLIN